jgi:hypothetical protein
MGVLLHKGAKPIAYSALGPGSVSVMTSPVRLYRGEFGLTVERTASASGALLKVASAMAHVHSEELLCDAPCSPCLQRT